MRCKPLDPLRSLCLRTCSSPLLDRGTVEGGTQPAVDCRGALRVEGGTFTSDATLMRFAETDETSAQGSFRVERSPRDAFQPIG